MKTSEKSIRVLKVRSSEDCALETIDTINLTLDRAIGITLLMAAVPSGDMDNVAYRSAANAILDLLTSARDAANRLEVA